jgi:hypothetical protein
MKEERDLAEATVEEEEAMAAVAAGADTGEVEAEATVAEEDMVAAMAAEEEGEEETEGMNEIAARSRLRRVRK